MNYRVGLVIAGLLAVSDLVTFALGAPPPGVVIASTVLGVITLVALVPAWRGRNRTAVLTVAASRIVSALLAVPAFFVDGVPAGIRVTAAIIIVLAIASTALILRAPRILAVSHRRP